MIQDTKQIQVYLSSTCAQLRARSWHRGERRRQNRDKRLKGARIYPAAVDVGVCSAAARALEEDGPSLVQLRGFPGARWCMALIAASGLT